MKQSPQLIWLASYKANTLQLHAQPVPRHQTHVKVSFLTFICLTTLSYLGSYKHNPGYPDYETHVESVATVSVGGIAKMATEANKDAAEQSLDIAKSALAAGHLEKAQKFAEKAMKLYPSDEVSSQAIKHRIPVVEPMPVQNTYSALHSILILLHIHPSLRNVWPKLV